ncbi:MAG: hypothetical protein COA77_03680 [Thaumarchaeota archaeon]|nr:MAG: hypothetical protein COA77_03680 [Nitrososphaerota archaeon]
MNHKKINLIQWPRRTTPSSNYGIFQNLNQVNKKSDFDYKKIFCLNCDSQDLKYLEIVNISTKGLKGKIPVIESGYEKNTFRSAHLCQKCGIVSLYPIMEA